MAATNYRIVGVGGAGCRIVDRIGRDMPDRTPLVFIDADAQTLGSVATPGLQIGKGLTGGLGTGGNITAGRRAAEADLPLVRGRFADTALVIVVAGLGGGLGTGAAPVILRSASEGGAATLCCAILPFGFEGEVRQRQARENLRAIRGTADCTLVLSNEHLAALIGGRTLSDTFEQANDFMAAALVALRETLVAPQWISMDFANLAHLFGDATDSRLAFAETVDPGAAADLVADLFASPLLGPDGPGPAARRALISVEAGRDVSLADLNRICHEARRALPAGAVVAVGVRVNPALAQGVRLLGVIGSGASPVADAAEPPPAAEAVRPPAAPPGSESAPPSAPDAAARARRKRKRDQDGQQELLQLEETTRGRFKGVSPTILGGEDLDTPTFLRRGLDIAR